MRSASENVAAPGRHDHELLQVEPVVGVRAAVDHVHQRDGQRARFVPAEPPVQRHAGVGGGGLRGGERAAEDRVRAEPALVRRPSSSIEERVDRALVVGVAPGERGGDLAVHVRDGGQHALAQIRARVSVAELDRLVLAGRRAGRHERPTQRAGVEHDVHLDRRIPARVEELACRGHARSRSSSKRLLRALVVPVLGLEVERPPVHTVLGRKLRGPLDARR